MNQRIPGLRIRGGRAALIIMAGVATGCSGDGPTEIEAPIILTALDFQPSASVISLQQPLNTVVVKATPLDQNGRQIVGAGAASFVSTDVLVATVGGGGTVSAVGTGQTVITATITIAGVTKTASATVEVAAEREPALVGTWRGPASGAIGTSTILFELRGDGSMSGVGDATWNNCPIEGDWHLAGESLVIDAEETACGTLTLAFTAPLTSTQNVSGSWIASNGVTGTFSLSKE